MQRRGVKKFNSHALTQLLWSLAVVRSEVQGVNELFEDVAAVAMDEGLQQWNEYEMCMLVWSFSKMGIECTDLFQMIEEKVGEHSASPFTTPIVALYPSLWIPLVFPLLDFDGRPHSRPVQNGEPGVSGVGTVCR